VFKIQGLRVGEPAPQTLLAGCDCLLTAGLLLAGCEEGPVAALATAAHFHVQWHCFCVRIEFSFHRFTHSQLSLGKQSNQ
jgi:hypothetical protein